MHITKLIIVALFSLILAACVFEPAPNGSYLIYPTSTPIVMALRPTKTLEPTVLATDIPVPTIMPARSLATPEPSVLWRVAVNDNVYTGPSRNEAITGDVFNSEMITLRGVRQIDGSHWYKTTTSRGLSGWVEITGLAPNVVAQLPEDTTAYIPPAPIATGTPLPRPAVQPAPKPVVPAVQTSVRVGAICGDGTRSSAKGRGACSRHGGVAQWLYK